MDFKEFFEQNKKACIGGLAGAVVILMGIAVATSHTGGDSTVETAAASTEAAETTTVETAPVEVTRGDFYDKLNSGNAVNVLVLGDGFAYGDGATNLEDSWSEQLSQKLGDAFKSNVFVNNYALAGDNGAYAGFVIANELTTDVEYDAAVLSFGSYDDQDTFPAFYEALIRALNKKFPGIEIISLIEPSSVTNPDGPAAANADAIKNITSHYLGETIDIHCGGQDLIFPHHENEISQGECCTGKPYAHYWMHNGYINVDNVKMSKSLGNFFTVRDVAEKYGYEPIKFMMIQAHYRMPLNYTVSVIESCKAALERLYTCRDNLDFAIEKALGECAGGEEEFLKSLDEKRGRFIAAMDDDLNTADAVSVLFDLVRDINTYITSPHSKASLEAAAKLFDEITGVLGILYNRKKESLDDEVEAMIAARQQARKEKNWAEADRIRDELKSMGIVLEDTPQGVKWKKA